MKVYRVETADGVGPYSGMYTLLFKQSAACRLVRRMEDHDAPRQPSPAIDGMPLAFDGMPLTFDGMPLTSSRYHFGFVDLAALWRWFETEIDMTDGLLCWFDVVEYRCVSKKIVGNSGQCAFIKPPLKPGRVLTIPEIMAARPSRSDND